MDATNEGPAGISPNFLRQAAVGGVVVLVTGFVVLTGSAGSFLVLGYYFTIIVCSTGFRNRQGEFAAAASWLAFAASSVLVSAGVLPSVNILGGPSAPSASSVAAAVFLNGLGFAGACSLPRFRIERGKALVERLERSETQLLRQNEIVKLLLSDFEDKASDWLFELDAGMRIAYLSEKVLAKAGPGEAILGRDAREVLLRRVDEGDLLGRALIMDLMAEFSEGAPFKGAEIKLRFDGAVHWIEIVAAPLAGAGGKPGGWRGVGRSITERKSLEMQLRRIAFTDERTELPNRCRFDAILADELGEGGRASRAGGMLGIVKLDNIDQIRRHIASPATDELIRRFVGSARGILGPSFALCRLEYDEFGLWTGEPSIEALERVHALSRSLRSPLASGSESFYLDHRIGIAFYPEDGDGKDELLRAADLALNGVRPSGTRVARYTAEHSSRFLRGAELARAIPGALEAGQFRVVYQPQFSAGDESLSGGEALLRWSHPSEGEVPPSEFIPLAERSGLILGLDEWAMDEACRAAALWPERVTVSVNVSAVQLKEARRLRNAVGKTLADSGLPPRRLVLEITESSLASVDEAGPFISSMRDLGVGVSLDDFGTGYSSLSYLNELRPDEIKIDRSFIRDLGGRGDAEKIVRSIIDLAGALGIETVAEGVETALQAEALRRLGCGILQGYLYGEPVAPARFAQIKGA